MIRHCTHINTCSPPSAHFHHPSADVVRRNGPRQDVLRGDGREGRREGHVHIRVPGHHAGDLVAPRIVTIAVQGYCAMQQGCAPFICSAIIVPGRYNIECWTWKFAVVGALCCMAAMLRSPTISTTNQRPAQHLDLDQPSTVPRWNPRSLHGATGHPKSHPSSKPSDLAGSLHGAVSSSSRRGLGTP